VKPELVGDDYVDSSIYQSSDIYESELEQIFYKTWVCLGHEAEVPAVGDFRATELGSQPVIIVRRPDNEIAVLLNRCRHRGALICDIATGHAEKFVCPYHGWSYDTTGRFLGAPYPTGYDRATFARENLSLLPVPRVSTYAGFIFASMSDDGEDLETHLGHARQYLDAFVGDGIAADTGRNLFGYEGNWKLATDNVVDGYHLPFIHESYFEVLRRRRPGLQPSSANPSLRSWALGNGHGMLDFRTYGDDGQIQEAPKTNVAGSLFFNLLVFPNLALAGDHIRLIRPRGVNETHVELVHVVPVSADDDERELRIRRHEDFYGPGGFAMPDDLEVAFRRVTEGMKANRGGALIHMGRGIHREQIDDRGLRWGHMTDETPQRGFYRQWRKMMNA
jgi:phenylpropionate dioxygenase-like ring-hydroxylating dioxygenase large terminal subunit